MYNNNQQYGRYNFAPYQQQSMQQPMYQQAISMQDMPIQAIKFMNEAEARAYIVMPNQKELLIDREKGVAYLKSADSMGQSSSRPFKFEEIKEPSVNPNAIDTSIFVTKDDTKDFVSKKDFDDLLKRFEALRSQLKPKVQQ